MSNARQQPQRDPDPLVENALHEDLKPVEQAKAFRTLMGKLNLTQRQLASKLQISQTTVSQSLDLLDLPESVRARVDAGLLAPSTAIQIAKIRNPAEQVKLADQVVAVGLTRAETVEVIKRATGRSTAKKVTHGASVPDRGGPVGLR